jgi:hypothetical protein
VLRWLPIIAIVVTACGGGKPFDGDGYQITVPAGGYEYTRVSTPYPGDKWVNSVGAVLVQRIDDLHADEQSVEAVRDRLRGGLGDIGFVETSASTVAIRAGDAYRITATNADGDNETVVFALYDGGTGWLVYFQAAPASEADQLIDGFSLDHEEGATPGSTVPSG